MATLARKIGIAPMTILELTPPEMVTVAAEAGYDFVGLRLVNATPEEPVRATLGLTDLIRETKARLDATGLELIDIEILRLKPETNVRADFEAFFETGAFLGASQALIAGNDPDHSRLADNYNELGILAGEYGITPNLEPMPWTDIRSITEARAVLAQATHSNIGILVDAIHWDRSDATLDDLRAVPAEYLHYMQLDDAPTEKPTTLDELLHQGRAHRYLPGHGGLDLVGLLNALPADLPISLEAPVVATAHLPAIDRARAALAATQEFLARPDVLGR
jgi:sugar phosphate isomerase/epimerase